MSRRRFGVLAASLAIFPSAAGHAESNPGPQGPEQTPFRRQSWRIPSSTPGLMMSALVFRPPGAGPFPLVVIAHSSSQSAESRARHSLAAYTGVAEWFAARGHAVVAPQRPGYGETGGTFLEDQGGCDDADFTQPGNGIAQSLKATMDYLSTQPFVRRGHAIIVGVSGGGWGALALAAQNPPGLRAVINVSGGLGGHSYDRPYNNCAPDRLVDAARAFGATARVPALWLYAENDTFFPRDLSRRMADAYRAGGGAAQYRVMPAVGSEGHALFWEPTRWGGEVERFLATVR